MKSLQYLFFIPFFILLTNCTNNGSMNLKRNQHLNDTAHFGNTEVLNEKLAVLKQLEEFDEWYRNETGEIEFRFDGEFWNMGFEYGVDDETRIKNLKENIIPKISRVVFFTKDLKQKAHENANLEDPGNVGYILSGSEYGKSLRYIVNLKGYNPFEGNLFLDFHYSEDPDVPEIRKISQDEKVFYHLSFIRIIDETHAVYRAQIEMTNSTDYPVNKGFLVIKMIKENTNWLIDDLYYIEKEELIETDERYKLPDYFKYKLDYEGVKKDPNPNPIP